MFTFTFSALVDTEVVHHRFAIDQKGKIYSMSANGELLKKMDISKGIKAAFEQIQNHLVSTKVATPVAKDEKVARPSPRANQAHLLQPAATNTSPFSLPLNGTLFNAQPGIKPLEVRTPVRPLEPKAPAAVAPIIQAPKPAVHSEIKPLEVRTPVRPLEPKAPAAVGPIILPPKPAAHSGIKPLEVRTPEKPLEPKAQVHAAPLIQPQKPAAHLPRRSAGRGTSAGAFKFHTKNPTQRPELGKPSAHPSSFFNNGQAKIQPAQGRAEKQSTPSGQAPKQHTLNNM